MVAAPVGFQCPVCVGAAAAGGPVARTVAGGTRVLKPTVTYVLIGINVAVFALQMLLGVDAIAGDWGMWPIGIGIYNEWWRLLTGAFLHGSFLHIAFNMYVLFALGPTLERVLGHGRYLLLYVVAALGGSVASYAFSDFQTVSVGASGAIFGLMGALVVAGRRLRYDIKQVVILLVINFVIGFIAPGVDWRAHLGGLLTGAAMAAVLVMAPRGHRMLWQNLGVVGILLVLGAMVAWRTADLLAMLAPIGGLAT
ncbi:MAG: rhomboid family intramembrane serine protease [Candidatus Nanopelagicales bacterium]|nr:rhomboid family intramembrane serine protease [Candidatus Nanopelagicales bacterium]